MFSSYFLLLKALGFSPGVFNFLADFLHCGSSVNMAEYCFGFSEAVSAIFLFYKAFQYSDLIYIIYQKNLPFFLDFIASLC